MAETFNPNRQYTKGELQALWVGKHLDELPTPSAVMDRHIVAEHCQKMLATCKALGVRFRPHIKTHKTLEGARLQIGPDNPDVHIVVSTINEIEHVFPFLQESKAAGKSVNVLYSMPFHPSALARLAKISTILGPETICLMVDHASQLDALPSWFEISPHPPLVFLKIDVGYHRAGLAPSAPSLPSLISAIRTAEAHDRCIFHGLYSHDSNSYSATSASTAMGYLTAEIEGLKTAAEVVLSQRPASSTAPQRRLVLSVGASPDATSAQNLLLESTDAQSPEAASLLTALSETAGTEVELHAGVYAFLDMQQLRTQNRPGLGATLHAPAGEASGLKESDVAFTVLAEVASVYPDRNPPQALITAGTLALGREPCLGYSGWGVVSDWGMVKGGTKRAADGEKKAIGLGKSGWFVEKISQEHGVVAAEGDGEADLSVWEVGKKVRVVTNHACIAGAGHPWYFVVDGGDEVVDVWIRCRGW